MISTLFYFNFWQHFFDNIVINKEIAKEINNIDNIININPDSPASTDSSLLLAALKATCGDIKDSSNQISVNGLFTVAESSLSTRGNIDNSSSTINSFTIIPDVTGLFVSKHEFTTTVKAKGHIRNFDTVQQSITQEPLNETIAQTSLLPRIEDKLDTTLIAGKNIHNIGNVQLSTIEATQAEELRYFQDLTTNLCAGKNISGTFSSDVTSILSTPLLDINNGLQTLTFHVSARRDIIVNDHFIANNVSSIVASAGLIDNVEQNALVGVKAERTISVHNEGNNIATVTASITANNAIDNNPATIAVQGQQTSKLASKVGYALEVSSCSVDNQDTISNYQAEFLHDAIQSVVSGGDNDVPQLSLAKLQVGHSIWVNSSVNEEATASSVAIIRNNSSNNITDSGGSLGGERLFNQNSLTQLLGKEITIKSHSLADPNSNISSVANLFNISDNFLLLETLSSENSGEQLNNALLTAKQTIKVVSHGETAFANLTNLADGFILHTSEVEALEITQSATAVFQSKYGAIIAKGQGASIINRAETTNMINNSAPDGTQTLHALLKAGGNIIANQSYTDELPSITNIMNASFDSVSGGQSTQTMQAGIVSHHKIKGVLFQDGDQAVTTISNSINANNPGVGDNHISAIIKAKDDITGTTNVISATGNNYAIEAVIRSKNGVVSDSFNSISLQGDHNHVVSKGYTDDLLTINNLGMTTLTSNTLKAGAGDDFILLTNLMTGGHIEKTTFIFEFGSGHDHIEGYLGGFQDDSADNTLLIDQKYVAKGFAINAAHIKEINGDTLVILSTDKWDNPVDTITIVGVDADIVANDIAFFS